MRFPLIPKKSLCIPNNFQIAFRFVTALVFAGAVMFCCPVQAAQQIVDEDLIALLALSLGGRDLAAVSWSNMSPSEKQTFRDQAERIAIMARRAEREGISTSPDVALAVKWGTDSLLAEAWEKKIIAETDLSDDAVRSFYQANIGKYLQPEAVRYRQATYPLTQKEVALRVKKQLQTASLSRLKNCIDVGWVEYEKLSPALAKALRDAPIQNTMGPLETPRGYVLYEVLERRAKGPLPLEKCKNRVREDLIQTAIKNRLQ